LVHLNDANVPRRYLRARERFFLIRPVCRFRSRVEAARHHQIWYWLVSGGSLLSVAVACTRSLHGVRRLLSRRAPRLPLRLMRVPAIQLNSDPPSKDLAYQPT